MQNIDKLIIIILSEKSSSSSYFSASYESIRVVQVTVQVLSLDGRTSQVLLERGYLFILFVVHSFTDKTWRVSEINLSLHSCLRWVYLPNEWLTAHKNRSVVTEVSCCAISISCTYCICGANSSIAFIYLFSSWCAVVKRRGGVFYLSAIKWCDPVARTIVATSYVRAPDGVPSCWEQFDCE